MIEAAFIPTWPENPYHSELIRSLAKASVCVRAPASLKALHHEITTGGSTLQVLHLHALPYLGIHPRDAARYLFFFLRLRALRRRGVRLIFTVHDFHNHDSRLWRLEQRLARRVARLFHAVIVHGENARSIVRNAWGDLPDRTVHAIPHGNYINAYPNTVPPREARARLNLAPSDVVLLFLGLIRPYKGVERLVEAFRSQPGDDLRLVIAGNPSSPKRGAGISRGISGDARIIFHPGRVDDAAVQTYMNASDVVVMPYKRAFTSGAAVLGMSFGKPCLAPATGAIADALSREGAFLFDPEIDGGFERAFRDLVTARDRWAAMGTFNRRRAESWDWDSIGGMTASVYQDTLQSKPKC